MGLRFIRVKALAGRGVTVGSIVAGGVGVLLPYSGIVGMINGVRPGLGVRVGSVDGAGVRVTACGATAAGLGDGAAQPARMRMKNSKEMRDIG